MGRKPGSSKNNSDKTTMDKVEDQSIYGKVKSPRASEVENLKARCAPLKILNQSANGVEAPPVKNSASGVEAHPAKISPQEQVNRADEGQKKSAKKSKTSGVSVRRSERIKSTVGPSPASSRAPEYIEDLTASESENDEQDHQLEKELAEVEPEPEPEPAENMSEKNLNEKVDHTLQKLDALDKKIDLLISKVDGPSTLSETPSKAINFRDLYISSQKQLEALAEENRLLTGKLENALGKLEVYEKDIRVPLGVLDKVKDIFDAVAVPKRAKTTEAAVKNSTPRTHNACSASAPKRKRNESNAT
ncbi:uncharacterized protein LOC130732683 [Lotus japonicus]|uniref:uncharacterized protein LOC130732683 n=1 Tax=Lotus japonicus TaxID=34305 RepID=UPI0025881F0F|nr:uncharacterized protein LOC130732683 [Lotus japonicus]